MIQHSIASSRLSIVASAAVLALLASVSCGRAQQGCLVPVTNTTFLTDGSADQGFGNPTPYRTPVRTISQGATQATSDPHSAFRVEGLGLAVRAPKAKNLAITIANTKAISDFALARASVCTLELYNSTSIIHLLGGSGSFIGGAVIEAAGRRVMASLQRAYTIVPEANPNLVDILVGNKIIKTVQNAGGNLLPPDAVMPKTITLPAGKYQLIVEITVSAKAEQQADLVAAAEANIR